MESNQLDLDFAKAWDKSQGDFSKNLAENILNYARDQKLKISTALDICCGTSNFLNILNNAGAVCFGTEIDQSMIDYSKEKYESLTYQLTKTIPDFNFKTKFDLITCNHDMINYLETFDEWVALFKSAIKHLNKKGLFIFDFYTKTKLKDWHETTFSSSDYLDCVLNVKSGLFDKTVLSYTYYINYEDYMIKTRSITTECYYETNVIVDALKKVGFKNVSVVKEQELPDCKFSTVEYPNPEEKSVFNIAIEMAKENNADLIIGTDPDCDRVGVVVKNSKDKLALANLPTALILGANIKALS